MEIDNIKEKLEKATIAVASVDEKGTPHNIIIMYAKFKDNKVVITDNYMKKTIENIKNNPYVSLVFWKEEEGWRVDGEAEYYDSGKWLNFVKALKENKELPAKGAVVINIKEIKKLG